MPLDSVAIDTPFLKIEYVTTPTLSVLAVQLRFICEEDITMAVTPVGVDGGVVSGACVVADTDDDRVEIFPAASLALI